MTKLNVLLALASSLMSGMAYAQAPQTKYLYTPTQQENTVTVSPTLGATYNTIEGIGAGIKAEGETGFSAGVLVDIGGGSTQLETGVLFSQLNTKISRDEASAIFVNNNLALPLQGKTYFSGQAEGLYVRYGALVNVLLNSTQKFNRGRDVDTKRLFNSVDPQGTVALGYKVQTPSLGLSVDLAFARSIVASGGLNRSNSDRDESWYNQTVLLSTSVNL